jgi:hypothetical protein
MELQAKSIRPFIGSKHFETSRKFYRELGFDERVIDNQMSVFFSGAFSFYLQNAYIKDWIDNTMVFMEVDNVEVFWKDLQALDLPKKFPGVRTVPIKTYDWGRECFVHDPSGVLWHFGEFAKAN